MHAYTNIIYTQLTCYSSLAITPNSTHGPIYMPRPMPVVLTDSLTHAFAMYEKNSFQNQNVCFICGQPSDIYISGHTPINNCVDNPPIYISGHIPINNCWSTLRNHVVYLHILFHGALVHMKCNMPFPFQFMLIYHACIY